MITIGLDDTDMLDTPGTNQLARHLVRELAGEFDARMILRHQLLQDQRVPCTLKNGCASIALEPKSAFDQKSLADRLRPLIVEWCPAGSDPGLCIADHVPEAVSAWGNRCQRELVTQQEARQIAAENGLLLSGLGGTEDGVIGALAAVGLMSTGNDGRVVYLASPGEDRLDVTGNLTVDAIRARGIEEIRDVDSGRAVTGGTVAVGKKLRPNYRERRVVLYVTQRGESDWEAVRVT